MTIKSSKRKITTRIIIFIIVVGIIAAFCVYLTDMLTKAQEKHDWLKNDIQSLNRKIEGMSTKATEFSEAISKWESFDEEHKKLRGLRITDAKAIIDELAEKYKITELKVTFSKPAIITKEMNADLTSDTVTVSSSNTSISFSAITDVQALQFLNELQSAYPGYIQITSFSLARSQVVSKNNLQSISVGKFPGLVQGKLFFTWRDLKHDPKSKDEEETKS